jgi:hypothetical protein
VDALESLQCRGTLALRNKKIHVLRTVYGDAQVYPYLYCGHYHRNAGWDGQEYRLVESLQLYAKAARVASSYRYDVRDCMQLMKHFMIVSSLILNDILLSPRDCGGIMKDDATGPWRSQDDAVADSTWLIRFFDSLMLWEEREQSAFVEVLDIWHKRSPGKLMQQFTVDFRIAEMQSFEEPDKGSLDVTEDRLTYFRNPCLKRLAKDSLLVVALSKGKVAVRDLEMSLPSTSEGECRQRKKRAFGGEYS